MKNDNVRTKNKLMKKIEILRKAYDELKDINIDATLITNLDPDNKNNLKLYSGLLKKAHNSIMYYRNRIISKIRDCYLKLTGLRWYLYVNKRYAVTIHLINDLSQFEIEVLDTHL